MDLTEKYKECKFTYSVPLLRAIEDMVLNERSYMHYEDWRGREYVVQNPNSLAEFRCDFQYAKDKLGYRGRGRKGYKQILEMKKVLNGEDRRD